MRSVDFARSTVHLLCKRKEVFKFGPISPSGLTFGHFDPISTHPALRIFHWGSTFSGGPTVQVQLCSRRSSNLWPIPTTAPDRAAGAISCSRGSVWWLVQLLVHGSRNAEKKSRRFSSPLTVDQPESTIKNTFSCHLSAFIGTVHWMLCIH